MAELVHITQNVTGSFHNGCNLIATNSWRIPYGAYTLRGEFMLGFQQFLFEKLCLKVASLMVNIMPIFLVVVKTMDFA